MRACVRYVSSIIVTLGTFAFWLGITIARRSYPSEYDWRYITISSLVYAERNPGGFLWARGGILLCGIAGLYWAARLFRRWKQQCSAERPIGILALGLGFLCMAGCALVPERRFPVPRGHDFLALAAFIGICVGMALITFKVVEQSPRVRELPGKPRWYARMLAGFAVFPILLAAVAQAYVSHALPALPWVSLAWRERGVPVYLSFAFWEWVTCAMFSLYVLVLSRTTAPSSRPRI